MAICWRLGPKRGKSQTDKFQILRTLQKATEVTESNARKRKVNIALRLRQETTMTLKWIAKRLKIGAWTHVSNLIAQQRQKGAQCK